MKQSANYLLCCLGLLFCLNGNVSGQDLEKTFQNDSSSLWRRVFKGDPFSISGSFGANFRSYQAWGVNDRQTPLSTTIFANATVRSYQITIPFSLLINNLDVASHPFTRAYFDGFLTNQRNRLSRFGMSPYYKWVKLHAGHRYMNFSEFTLNNHNFLGGGVELTPGKWRFAAMAGRLARAEPINLSLNRPNVPVYERNGWGMKIGYGTQGNFIDFIVFKAQEDPNSISRLRDSNSIVLPSENLVFGLKMQKKLLRGLRFEFDGAYSAFTRNNEDPTTNARSFLYENGLFRQRSSTIYRGALNTGLRYQLKKYTLGFEYRRVEPGYRSLGTYFFNDDFENYTLQFSGSALRRKLQFSSSVGWQENNLDGSKPATFRRWIGSANLGYQIPNWFFNLDVSNFSSRVDYLLNPDADSLNVIVVTREATGSISRSIARKGGPQHTITLTAGAQGVTNNLVTPAGYVGSGMYFGNLAYTLSTPQRWQWTLNVDLNNNDLGPSTQNRLGGGARANKSWFNSRLNAGVGSQGYFTRSEQFDSRMFNHHLQFSYRTKSRHTFQSQLNFIRNRRVNNNETRRFSEFIATIGYITQFGVSNQTKKPTGGAIPPVKK
jgi:hypothetical protein